MKLVSVVRVIWTFVCSRTCLTMGLKWMPDASATLLWRRALAAHQLLHLLYWEVVQVLIVPWS